MTTEPPEPARRDRLIRAAERCFARKGFHAATVPDIAAEAGVSQGLLYRYFPGKAALAVAIVEADREATRAAIEELIAAYADPRAALAALIRGWVEIALSDREACALVAEIGAEAARDDRIRAVVLDADRVVTGLIAGLIERACPALPAAPSAIWLQSALDGLVGRIAIDPAFDPRPAAGAIVAALAIEEVSSDVR